MRVAVVGSRHCPANAMEIIEAHLPPETTLIVSGGAIGIDTAAADVARKKGIPLMEIRPDYPRYGRSAPIRRNDIIIDEADLVLAFWDGQSRGTHYVMKRCAAIGKPLIHIPLNP